MRIAVDKEKSTISVPCEELAHFARTRGGRSRLSFIECSSNDFAASTFAEKLSYTVNEEGVDFTVTGVADVVCRTSDGGTAIETFAEKRRVTSRTHPAADPEFMAKGVLLAYMIAKRDDLSCVTLVLTYTSRSGEAQKSFYAVLQTGFLHNMTQALLLRAVPFIEVEAEKILCGRPSLVKMAFPYSSIRDAQRDFINDSYRALRSGSRLLVSAPTGVGKTISALYPALRALGNGTVDRIFYLTAKTPTGKSAAEACRVMSSQVQTLRCITVIAKEKLCSMSDVMGRGGTLRAMRRCRECPLMGEIGCIPYEERRDSALLELLKGNRIIDTETVKNTAERYRLCPYELSLDISEYCEVVICDYNYAFDPSVRFRRYFENGAARGEKYAFLVDEAHNLPDRAREMYSGAFDASAFVKLYRLGAEAFAGNKPLLDAVGEVIKKLRDITALCKSEEIVEGGERMGYYISNEMYPGLPEALLQFSRAAGKTVLPDDCSAAEPLEKAVQSAGDFLRSAALFGKGFVFYCELSGPRLTVSSRCLDPSEMLDRMMTAAHGVILFSATLTPMDYFADVLGCRTAVRLELDSPYDPANLCLIGFDSISTRYADRADCYDEIAEVIAAVCEAKEGNYIVYFPSYEYMSGVVKAFRELSPDTECAVQSRSMNYGERNAFLEKFSKRDGTLVGFCVLGGAFAEGVDLKGEKLIGTIIIGTGLPKMCSELNILSEYFEKTRENGRDYAYTYPAMIKVEQAAGRVIRSETDRGVVVLVDDRYAEPATYRLFPKNWRHIKYTGDPYLLNTALYRFWGEE